MKGVWMQDELLPCPCPDIASVYAARHVILMLCMGCQNSSVSAMLLCAVP